MRINLYKSFIENKDFSFNEPDKDIYFSFEKSLLAINLKSISLQEQLNSLKDLWKTKPIEIYQKNFILLILYAKKLDITIREIVFDEGNYFDEDITDYIDSQNYEKIVSVINDYEDVSIEKISFILGETFGEDFDGVYITISKEAQINCNVTLKEEEILNQRPVQLLLGYWSYPLKGDL